MSRNVRWLISGSIIAAAIVIALLSFYPAPSTPLADLKTVDDLRNRFNRDKGYPRLVLLLSPT